MDKLLYENEMLYRINDGISKPGLERLNEDNSLEQATYIFVIKEVELEEVSGKLNKMIGDLNNFYKLEKGNIIPAFLKTGQRGRFNLWQKVFKAGHYVFFGLSPDEIGLQINVNAYHMHSFLNRKLLFTHPLNDVLGTDSFKKKFWQVIKDEIV
jgi:hypothetical protein